MLNPLELAKSRFSPLRHKHFRALFAVQGISLIGTFMQELARSWLVINLVGKASAIGALLFAAALPNLMLFSFGGVMADQRGVKRILMLTQIGMATSAFGLGLLVMVGHVQFWHLLIFAALEGSILAFDGPAFATVTPQLVPREEFQKALAINSVNFHLSRVLGPSIAGVIMGIWGPAAVFWGNAVSFIGVIFVIAWLPLAERKTDPQQPRKSMKEAFVYLRSHPWLRRIVIQFFSLMALVFPLVFTTLRLYIQNKFNLDARHYGLVFAVPGVGALVGSLSFLIWNPKNPMVGLPFGICGLCSMLFVLAGAPTLPLSMLALFLFSVSTFLTISSLLVTVQVRVEDHIRGRISALIGISFMGISPIMAVPIGALTDWLGAPLLMRAISLIFFALSAYLAWRDRVNGHAVTAA